MPLSRAGTRRKSAWRRPWIGCCRIFAAVHTPRLADGNDRGGQDIHFRRWQRPSPRRALHDAKAQRAVLFDPELRLGEAYMDGTFVVDQGSIADVLALLMRQDHIAPPRWALPLRFGRYLFRRLQQFNPRSRSRHNVAHHYDLDGRLYQLFLDTDQQYSCAYFETPEQSLDDAQLAKKRHLAAKLRVEPGQRCSISDAAGADSRFISPRSPARTLPASHCRRSNMRARNSERSNAAGARGDFPARGLSRRRRTIRPHRLRRHVRACRRRLLRHILPQVRELLDDDGVFLLHTIGRSGSPSVTNPWIAKYIFPGGYIPALSEVLPAIQRARLVVTDVEILQLHYAETLKAWRERFLAHREDVERLYDRASCACGSSTSHRRRWRSAKATWSCSRSRWRSARASCRRPATISGARKRGCARSKPATRAPMRLAGE